MLFRKQIAGFPGFLFETIEHRGAPRLNFLRNPKRIFSRVSPKTERDYPVRLSSK